VPQRTNGGIDARARRDAIIDKDDSPPFNAKWRSVAAIEHGALFQLGLCRLRDLLDLFVGNSRCIDDPFIQESSISGCDRTKANSSCPGTPSFRDRKMSRGR
jgi:hypothetical protein